MKENSEGRCVGLRDSFIYENHLGQRFEEDCVYLNYSDLRDYSWSCDTMNSRISRFYRSITERKLPLVIVGKTGDEATEIKNRLFEIAEADIMAMIPGKIYSGEYYTQGYITASAKSKYLINKRFSKIDLTLTSDDPVLCLYSCRFLPFSYIYLSKMPCILSKSLSKPSLTSFQENVPS